jgi:hypothetical protein
MNWLSVETAPFDRDLELAVIDFDGVHPSCLPAVVFSAVGQGQHKYAREGLPNALAGVE